VLGSLAEVATSKHHNNESLSTAARKLSTMSTSTVAVAGGRRTAGISSKLNHNRRNDCPNLSTTATHTVVWRTYATNYLQPVRSCSSSQNAESKRKSNPDHPLIESQEQELSSQPEEPEVIDEIGGDSVQYSLTLTDEELKTLTKGDPELVKKVKYIQLEHAVYR
jgi:hypothetical protein